MLLKDEFDDFVAEGLGQEISKLCGTKGVRSSVVGDVVHASMKEESISSGR